MQESSRLGLPGDPVRNTRRVTSERFQRPSTAAGARAADAASAVPVSDLPPHPPDVRDEEVDAVLAADFPLALRGYDRTAVDAYVQRASRVIAELRAGSSPQSAVRYALEQVSEETRSILQEAHDTADTMTTRAREQTAEWLESAERDAAEMRAASERDAAELRTASERDAAQTRVAAERDAADLRAAADQRVREAEDELADIWHERQRLIDDARDIAARLAEIAEPAAEREPPPQIALTEDDTHSLPVRSVWDDEVDDDDYDDQPPPPALRAVPPPPLAAAPEPALADAPPPPSESPGLLAFELREPELGPMDEPAAAPAVEEAAVPAGDTVEFTPPFAESGPPAPEQPPLEPNPADHPVPDERDKEPPHGDELSPLVDDDDAPGLDR
jgi:hypothetical protein